MSGSALWFEEGTEMNLVCIDFDPPTTIVEEWRS